MGENYYYMWETVTSITILILIAAYVIHSTIRKRYEALDEAEKNKKTVRLGGAFQLGLGLIAAAGCAFWIYYLKTVKIYISPELEGFYNYTPPIVIGIIGLILLAASAKKYFTQ